MQEIKYLLPPQKVFSGSKKVLIRNGFTIIASDEHSKEIRAVKRHGLLGPKLDVNLLVKEHNGLTSLMISSTSAKGVLSFSSGKEQLSTEKLIDQLNTHLR